MKGTLILTPIWQQCISNLETEISEQQLNTWILPLQAQHELGVLEGTPHSY